MIQGLLTEVVEDTRGSQATADVATGSSSIPVEDITDFPEAGGTLDVAGLRCNYTAVVPDPSTVITDIDPDGAVDGIGSMTNTGSLTLEEPLTADVTEDDPVLLVLGDQTASDAYAVVDIPSGDDSTAPGGDVVKVPISYDQRPMFTVGPYDPPVAIQVADDLGSVLTVPGIKPTIDASNVVNLPTSGAEPTDPPDASPAIELHGTADSLIVEVTDDFAGTTTLDFHISATADFTPSADTLAGSARSAVFVITGLPGVDSETPLALDTTYYVCVVARNSIGSAAPSAQASAALDPSVISTLVAAKLVAGFVLAGSIQAGNITIDPVTGITIPQSDGGIIQLPADGSVATIAAHVNARSLRVDDDFTIAGYGELAGEMQVDSGVSNPSAAPTITAEVPYIDLVDTNQEITGIFCVTSTTRALVATATSGGGWALGVWDITTGQKVGSATVSGFDTTDRTIKSMQISQLDGNLYALTFGSDNVYRLYRININTTTATAVKTVATWSTTALKYAQLALPSLGTYAVITFERYNSSGAFAGISARFFDISQAAMPQVGGDVVLTTGGQHLWQTTIADGPAQEAYVLCQLMDDTVPAWHYADSTNPPTLPRATAEDLVQPSAEDLYWGPSASSDTSNEGNVYAMVVGTSTTVRLYRMREVGPLTFNAAYTWYDGDTTGGTHESKASPTKAVTLPSGRFPTVACPAPPEASITDPGRVDKANRIGLYASVGSAAVKRQLYLPIGTYGSKAGTLNLNALAVLDDPPTSNGFVGSTSTPGWIHSAALDANQKPLWQLLGDGSARLGNLSVAANGAVSNSSSPLNFRAGSVTLSTDANGQVTIPHGGPAAPIWGDVKISGTVTYVALVTSYTATGIVATIYTRQSFGGTAVASTSLPFRWIAAFAQ